MAVRWRNPWTQHQSHHNQRFQGHAAKKHTRDKHARGQTHCVDAHSFSSIGSSSGYRYEQPTPVPVHGGGLAHTHPPVARRHCRLHPCTVLLASRSAPCLPPPPPYNTTSPCTCSLPHAFLTVLPCIPACLYRLPPRAAAVPPTPLPIPGRLVAAGGASSSSLPLPLPLPLPLSLICLRGTALPGPLPPAPTDGPPLPLPGAAPAPPLPCSGCCPGPPRPPTIPLPRPAGGGRGAVSSLPLPSLPSLSEPLPSVSE